MALWDKVCSSPFSHVPAIQTGHAMLFWRRDRHHSCSLFAPVVFEATFTFHPDPQPHRQSRRRTGSRENVDRPSCTLCSGDMVFCYESLSINYHHIITNFHATAFTIRLAGTTKVHFGVFLVPTRIHILVLVPGSKCVNSFQVRECRLDISRKTYSTAFRWCLGCVSANMPLVAGHLCPDSHVR